MKENAAKPSHILATDRALHSISVMDGNQQSVNIQNNSAAAKRREENRAKLKPINSRSTRRFHDNVITLQVYWKHLRVDKKYTSLSCNRSALPFSLNRTYALSIILNNSNNINV